VHVEEGSGGDGALCFPVRLQRLKPESFETWLASWLAPFRAIGRPPEGIVRAFALRGEDDPDFAMGVAFFRGSFERFRGDHHGAIEASRKAQERVVDQIWIDAAYELVDEVVPARF
jgi:hypothetical protein